MKVFSPRETSAQNIAYISIMASIDVVFALFATFFPFGAIFLMLLLPLPSAVAAYYCKNRYIPVYLLASIGLSLIATIWDFQLTLFYAIPAICSGTLYGFLKQKRLTIGEIVFVTGILNMGLTYVSILLIDAIYSIDMINFLLTIITVQDAPLMPLIMPAAILAYALAQEAIVNIIMQMIMESVPSIERPYGKIHSLLYPAFGLLSGILLLVISFFSIETAYCFLISAIFWLPFSLSSLFPTTRKWIYVPLVFAFLAGMSFFYIFYRSLPRGYGLLLFACPCVAIELFIFIYRAILFKKDADPKIRVGTEKL
jgi:hypothetical protein